MLAGHGAIDANARETIYNTPRLLSTLATYAAMRGDVEILERAAQNSPSPDRFCDLAVWSAAEGDTAKAEKCLQTAHYMIPCKIRPQYELYRLYAAKGDTAMARTVVEKLMSSGIEAKSSAALRMTGEMKRFYKNTME